MYNSAFSRHIWYIWRLAMSTNNRINIGPAWAEEPFHTITHEFWPDLIKLREEAIAVREYNEHRLTVQVPNGRDDVDDVVFDGKHPWHQYTYHPCHRHPSKASCIQTGNCSEAPSCTTRRSVEVSGLNTACH